MVKMSLNWQGKSLSRPQTLSVGTCFLGISIVWRIFNQFISIFSQAGNPTFASRASVVVVVAQTAVLP